MLSSTNSWFSPLYIGATGSSGPQGRPGAEGQRGLPGLAGKELNFHLYPQSMYRLGLDFLFMLLEEYFIISWQFGQVIPVSVLL